MKSYDEMFGGTFAVKPKIYDNSEIYQYFYIPIVPLKAQSTVEVFEKPIPEKTIQKPSTKIEPTKEQTVETPKEEPSVKENVEVPTPIVEEQKDIIVEEVKSSEEKPTGIAVYENVEEFEVKQGLFGRLIAKRKKK